MSFHFHILFGVFCFHSSEPLVLPWLIPLGGSDPSSSFGAFSFMFQFLTQSVFCKWGYLLWSPSLFPKEGFLVFLYSFLCIHLKGFPLEASTLDFKKKFLIYRTFYWKMPIGFVFMWKRINTDREKRDGGICHFGEMEIEIGIEMIEVEIERDRDRHRYTYTFTYTYTYR